MDHEYNDFAIVDRWKLRPSETVEKYAQEREDSGNLPVYKGTTRGVMHFEVASRTDNGVYRVEYDIKRNTFRCNCPYNFYFPHKDAICHHILMVNDIIPWQD